jgi:hemerythrin
MGFIDWKEEYATGVSVVDAQHQCMFELINALHDAMREGQTKVIIGTVLDDLVAYTKVHFHDEEVLMEQYGFAGWRRHTKEHQAFASEIEDASQRYLLGRPINTVDLITRLKQWLTSHILGTDQEFGPFLRARGVK